jgi:hypothetical protein
MFYGCHSTMRGIGGTSYSSAGTRHSLREISVGRNFMASNAYSKITSTGAAGVAGPNHHQPISVGVNVMKSFTFIATALVLSGPILSVAKAAPPSDVATAVVKFDDLDANRPAGKGGVVPARDTSGAHGMPFSGSERVSGVTPVHRARIQVLHRSGCLQCGCADQSA